MHAQLALVRPESQHAPGQLDDAISRAEILSGLPARRAQTLLLLIEARTAYVAARAMQLTELFPTEASTGELNQAYLEAIRLSHELSRRPTIQEIEQYASAWSHLVPPNPSLRAALAYQLAKKYTFTLQATPAIRAAFGLDAAPVQQAYAQRYGQPLATIYAPQVKPTDRLRWVLVAIGGWLDTLPPFWQAFIFTGAMSFPQATLALSIGMAGIGPVAGAALLVLFGLVNMVTLAALVEAVTRNGAIRYGNAFLGRVAADYLGRGGSLVMTLAAGVFVFLGEIAALMGLAKTLSGFIGGPVVIWVAALFAFNAYRLARQASKLSLSLITLLATIVIGLLLILSLLAFTHLHAENFHWPALTILNHPVQHGQSFPPALSPALLGILLTAYYGHLFVSQGARVVLPRDASGRSLLQGSVAAFALITLIFILGNWRSVAPSRPRRWPTPRAPSWLP